MTKLNTIKTSYDGYDITATQEVVELSSGEDYPLPRYKYAVRHDGLVLATGSIQSSSLGILCISEATRKLKSVIARRNKEV